MQEPEGSDSEFRIRQTFAHCDARGPERVHGPPDQSSNTPRLNKNGTLINLSVLPAICSPVGGLFTQMGPETTARMDTRDRGRYCQDDVSDQAGQVRSGEHESGIVDSV